MKFDNPLRLDCPGCGASLTIPLPEVVGLRARCPHCGQSLRELGRSMRQHATAMAAYFVAWETVWIFESRHGFTTTDAEVEGARTPGQLVELVRAKSGGRATQVEVLNELAGRIRRPLDPSHLDIPLAELVPEP